MQTFFSTNCKTFYQFLHFNTNPILTLTFMLKTVYCSTTEVTTADLRSSFITPFVKVQSSEQNVRQVKPVSTHLTENESTVNNQR